MPKGMGVFLYEVYNVFELSNNYIKNGLENEIL